MKMDKKILEIEQKVSYNVPSNKHVGSAGVNEPRKKGVIATKILVPHEFHMNIA